MLTQAQRGDSSKSIVKDNNGKSTEQPNVRLPEQNSSARQQQRVRTPKKKSIPKAPVFSIKQSNISNKKEAISLTVNKRKRKSNEQSDDSDSDYEQESASSDESIESSKSNQKTTNNTSSSAAANKYTEKKEIPKHESSEKHSTTIENESNDKSLRGGEESEEIIGKESIDIAGVDAVIDVFTQFKKLGTRERLNDLNKIAKVLRNETKRQQEK